jgi:SAM-dependent methyltransferase
MKQNNNTFLGQVDWVKNFVNKVNNASTTQADWQQYDAVAKQLAKTLCNISAEEKIELKEAYGRAMSAETLQGFVLTKPHGYAGDYEIVDKLYTFYTSPDERLAKWDEYFHAMPAAKAVRNRKTYIKNLLGEKMKIHWSEQPFEMLNLASGPARDLFEFFDENRGANVMTDCIDLDCNAIRYASTLLAPYSDSVTFHNKNVLRFHSSKCYDLVWSAGLFDYFNDDIFQRLVQKFLQNVKPGGELVIGNFCTSNPNIDYMELLDWKLYHRSADDLIRLVSGCGVAHGNITIDKEPEEVNLFIRINKTA